MSLLLALEAEWPRTLHEESREQITGEEILRRPVIELPNDLRLIARLCNRPAEIHSLTWREFQQLSADLLREFGYTVTMGREGRDGGVDVFAERPGRFGPDLVLVQSKRNSETNKVGEPVLKQLLGDVELRNATRGLLITTSTFTGPALALIDRAKYRLEGADHERINAWLAELRQTLR